MTELKTLKDFEIIKEDVGMGLSDVDIHATREPFRSGYKNGRENFTAELKELAIKWIKERLKVVNKIYGRDFLKIDSIKGDRMPKIEWGGGTYELEKSSEFDVKNLPIERAFTQGQIDTLILFFNITEGDLK